jgi:general secretion pathway protein N
MRRRTLLLIALGFYAVILVVEAPATLVDAALRRVGNERLRLVQAQGSVWSGKGILEIRSAGATEALARPISWRVQPASLWRGQLVCEVRLDPASPPITVAASPTRVQIDGAEIDLPADALALAEPRLKPLKLKGDIQIRLDGFSLARNSVNGGLVVLWQSAGSDFSPVSPMGSYELRVDGEGQDVRARLTTNEGPLQLDGAGTWKVTAPPRFTATARVPPEYREQFVPLLRLIAVQRDEETFELRLQ